MGRAAAMRTLQNHVINVRPMDVVDADLNLERSAYFGYSRSRAIIFLRHPQRIAVAYHENLLALIFFVGLFDKRNNPLLNLGPCLTAFDGRGPRIFSFERFAEVGTRLVVVNAEIVFPEPLVKPPARRTPCPRFPPYASSSANPTRKSYPRRLFP